jgi:hypothetical protein
MSHGFTTGLLNIYFLYRPPLGTAASTLGKYIADHQGRLLCILSAVLLSLGDLSQYMGGQAAGYAAAGLVSAWPIVGVFWGLLHFKEHRGGEGSCTTSSSKKSVFLLMGQVACYAGAIGLLAASAAETQSLAASSVVA